jgi:hypothetical protein
MYPRPGRRPISAAEIGRGRQLTVNDYTNSSDVQIRTVQWVRFCRLTGRVLAD